MRLSVVSVAGDAGGAEALAPVLQALQRRGALAQVYAAGPAAGVWDRAGIEHRVMPADPEAALAAVRPTVVLTGTSWGRYRPELAFLEAAETLHVPSVAVVDFWSNYLQRFVRPDGEIVFPDRVAVPDEGARQEAAAEGIPGERLAVTGNPYYEELLGRYHGFGLEQRLSFRERVGIGRKALVVLFVSQPIAALYDDQLGYTEKTALAGTAAALEQVAEWLGHQIVLAVRKHPREGHLELPKSTGSVRVVPAAGEEALAWALACDLVVGMNSAVLMQAALLGGRVVSVQPGLEGADLLPGNRLGITEPAYTQDDVAPTIFRALARPAHLGTARTLHRMRASIAGSTARVLDLVVGLGTREPVGDLAPEAVP